MKAARSKPLRWLAAAFRWSWVVTLPVTILYGLWAISLVGHYLDFGLRWDVLGSVRTLHRYGDLEARRMLREAQLELRGDDRTPTRLQRVHLFIGDKEVAALEEHLPHSGRNYVEGGLLYPNGNVESVDLKYRGDFHWHWAFPKKSTRVKTSRKHLYQRMRAFNVVAPKFLARVNNHLSYRLGLYLDLITPHSEMVEVSINGENRGVHLLVEQLEEMVLRRNDRMPGDLFAGELIGRDQVEGLDASVFHHPELWEKIAVNNHFPEEATTSLDEFCRLVTSPPSEASMDELLALVDVDAFARFSAFRSLCQTIHFDKAHNWRLYYDPWRNVFEPVNWDATGWHPNHVPNERKGYSTRPDVVSALVDEQLLRSHRLLLARQRAFVDFYERRDDDRFLAELDGLIEDLRPAIERDPTLVTMWRWYEPEEVLEEMRLLRGQVRTIFDDLERMHLAPGRLEYALDEESPGRLRLAIDGPQPVERLSLEFSGPPIGPFTARVSWLQDGRLREADVSGAVRVQGSVLELDLPLLARHRVADREDPHDAWKRGLEITPGVYDLDLGLKLRRGASLREVNGHFGAGQRVVARRVEGLEPTDFAGAFHVVDPRPPRPVVWEGVRAVSGIETVRDDVEIRPGTVFEMQPGAALILEGRLSALGTEHRPIVFKPAEAGQEPWGVFALRGPGADGSRLEHCRFEGGSGIKDDLYEYSAMFSIHDVPTVTVSDTVFRDSRVVDDMVHTVYSHVEFRDCTFARSLFDALDMDISSGVVERCQFVKSGNDALDLMTSNVVVLDTTLRDSGDKGISVGEDTRLLAINVKAVGCAIGVQAKDRSQAVLSNVDFVRNVQAVDAYRKNWRYDGGGTVRIYNSYFEGNGSNLTADKHSSLRVHDSYLDVMPEASERIELHPTVDGRRKRVAVQPRAWTWPEDEDAELDLFKRYWGSVNPRARGARDL